MLKGVKAMAGKSVTLKAGNATTNITYNAVGTFTLEITVSDATYGYDYTLTETFTVIVS